VASSDSHSLTSATDLPFPVFAIECRRWERNLKIQTILPLALASLVFGCGGQMSSNEAGLLDAVAFLTGGQQEGAIPQGFETHWRRTVHGREIKYQSIGPYVGFGQANDQHRDSRHVRIGVTITSPTKCVFNTVVTTEYSRGANRESFGDATSEVATLDFNKVRRFDIEDGDSPNVVIEGTGWMCKQGGCQDIVKIGISAPRQEEARAIESKRHAIDFIKKACPGLPRDRDAALDALREILAARASGPAVLTFNAGGAQLIFSHLPSAT
jgi:hypothetical protein